MAIGSPMPMAGDELATIISVIPYTGQGQGDCTLADDATIGKGKVSIKQELFGELVI